MTTAATDRNRPNSRIWHRGVLAAGFLVVACFYAWTNGPTAASWRIGGQQSDYYNVLMHGFLKGHLYMDVPVAPELMACPDPWNPAVRGPNCPILQDATYYNGHYYLYYGVAPLSLMLPFRLITGADLPLSLAALCFAWAGLLVSLVLWESIRERYFPDVRAWVGLGAVLILGVASPLPVLLRRTLVYELPIACGYFFGMAVLLSLYRSIHSQRLRIRWLLVASLCLGLAVASRLTFLFAMPILLIPVWIAWREQDRRTLLNLPVRVLVAAVTPIAVIGALMAVYNYERYGQFGEFGTSYQVAEVFYLAKTFGGTIRNFTLVDVPFNFFDYFLATPDLSRHFPFFLFPGTWHWPIHARPGYWGPELVPGMAVCFPICWLAALSVFAGTPGTDSQRSRLRGWLFCPWGLFLGNAFSLLCFHAGAVRYMVDFTPALMLCTAVGLLGFERWLLRQGAILKVIGRATWLGLLTASLLVAVLFSVVMQGTFRAVDPVGFVRVARFFEGLSFWNPRLPNRETGPVEIAVRFDKPFGVRQSEPLFVCGAGNASEHVFLRRTDDDHVVVGYRRGLGGEAQLSAPILAPPGGVHRLYIDLGSLYAEAPGKVAEAKTLSSFDDSRKRWVVYFDDEIVLQGRYQGDQGRPVGNLVLVGCDPLTEDFGKVLLTPILSVRRLSAAEVATRAANRPSMSLEFKPPRILAQGLETLLAVIGSGCEFRVQIEYVSAGRAELRFWRDGREVGRAAGFPNNGRWHRLNLDQVCDDREKTIHVQMDGAPLAAMAGGRTDFRRDELRPGWAAASTGTFTGFIRGAASESVQPVKLPPRGNRTALTVVFPQKPNGVCEPLLVTGQNGAGDLYEVMYLDPGELYFRQDHWGAGIMRASQPIKVNPEIPHRIVFEFVPQNPGVPPPGGIRNGVMHMTFDGQRVWDKDAPSNPFTDDQVYVGRNDIGGSTCSQEFTGEIISCDTSPDRGGNQ